jgi:hypothetical protein
MSQSELHGVVLSELFGVSYPTPAWHEPSRCSNNGLADGAVAPAIDDAVMKV